MRVRSPEASGGFDRRTGAHATTLIGAACYHPPDVRIAPPRGCRPARAGAGAKRHRRLHAGDAPGARAARRLRLPRAGAPAAPPRRRAARRRDRRRAPGGAPGRPLAAAPSAPAPAAGRCRSPVVANHHAAGALTSGRSRDRARPDRAPFAGDASRQGAMERAALPAPDAGAARRVVASSEATARDLRFYIPQCAERLRVVHLGVDPEFQPGRPEEIARTRAEFDAPDGFLFFAGTLEPRKGVDTLLDAWEALRREDPATPPLILAGPYGWRSPQLLRRMARLEPLGVRYLGRDRKSTRLNSSH